MRKLPTVNEIIDENLGGLELTMDADMWHFYKDVIRQCIESHTAAHTAALQERVKELEAWKESASTVLNELDLQSLGQKLGIKLGESISKQLPGKVDALKAENERYRKALEDVIIRLEEDKRFNALSIAKEALKQQ